MSKVLVTGIGLVTALGEDRETTWSNLLVAKSGINLVQLSTLGLQPSELILPLAKVDDLAPESPVLPRVQRFMQQAVAEAIADAELDLPLPNCGVAIGSSRGYQKELELFLIEQQKHPTLLFLPSHLSAAIAAQIQTQATVLAPMAACATGNWAIALAYELIQTGQCSMAIAGASDAAITSLSIAGFRKLGAMAHTGLYPFSYEREGLVLGEGAAALVLETEESAIQRGCQHVYGQVLGIGITNDAYHATSPAVDRTQAAIAIQSCLERSHLSIAAVNHINPHGTGTLLNDSAEAALIASLFRHSPPISATKGATGHALGATGLMEAAFCLLALQRQVLPPCVGMRSPAFDLDFVRIPRPTSLNIALNFSFGFGGQNTAIAFGKYSSA